MTILALALSIVLAAIAVLHLSWALGHWWPLRDETALARAVVGRRGITRMPGAVPTALVVVALLGVLRWVWLMRAHDHWLVTLGGLAIAAVFLARGAASLAGVMARLMPEEPFATLDRRYYGPLCLALGLGVLVLALG
jgi:hypothetical protein